MKFTVVVDLSLEDLAALADCAYRPNQKFAHGQWIGDDMAKPTQSDITRFVRDAVREDLHHKYISSGAKRKDYLEHWKKL